MNQFPVTCSNAYMEGFIKTCADLNLDADTSATLLQTRQREELFAESPAYRDGFKSAMNGGVSFKVPTTTKTSAVKFMDRLFSNKESNNRREIDSAASMLAQLQFTSAA